MMNDRINIVRQKEFEFKEKCIIEAIKNGKDLAFWGIGLHNIPDFDGANILARFQAKEIPYEYADLYECDCCGNVAIPELANCELLNLHDLKFIATMSGDSVDAKFIKAWISDVYQW